MPDFDNQRRCVQGKENLNSILIDYSVSLELVLRKYATIYSVRGTMTLLKPLTTSGPEVSGCAPEPSMKMESRAFLLTGFAGRHWAPSFSPHALLQVGLKAIS